MAQFRDWFFGLFGSDPKTEEGVARSRGHATHVIILDGTMSTLTEGRETNAGLTFKLLREASSQANISLYYEAGIQWRDWSGTYGVVTGKGINKQIKRAYGVLATRYRPGDRVILIGYSRGAYAVRSLAGVIGAIGLLRSDMATERAVVQAYRHYRTGGRSKFAQEFREINCHSDVQIEAVAVWDTVKALGLRLPIAWRWAQAQNSFHDHYLGNHVLHGFHALALQETREAFAPVLWESSDTWPGHLEQVWFRGTHGDVGGQLAGKVYIRPLSNIPLVWILEKLESCHVPLPEGWRDRFDCDVTAPTLGTWAGWAKMFLSRRRRIIGLDRSESLHPTAASDPKSVKLYYRRSKRLAGDLHNQTSS